MAVDTTSNLMCDGAEITTDQTNFLIARIQEGYLINWYLAYIYGPYRGFKSP